MSEITWNVKVVTVPLKLALCRLLGAATVSFAIFTMTTFFNSTNVVELHFCLWNCFFLSFVRQQTKYLKLFAVDVMWFICQLCIRMNSILYNAIYTLTNAQKPITNYAKRLIFDFFFLNLMIFYFIASLFVIQSTNERYCILKIFRFGNSFWKPDCIHLCWMLFLFHLGSL